MLSYFSSFSSISVCRGDLVIVFDDSGSIRDNNIDGEPDNYDTMKTFAKNLVNTLDVREKGFRVGVVTFSNFALPRVFLNDFYRKTDINLQIDALPYEGGNTNTTGGLRVARTELFVEGRGARPDFTDVILLFTDGKPTREVNGLASEVATLKSMGVKIVGVGVTKEINEQDMRLIVSEPSYYVPVEDFSALQTVVNEVSNIICKAVRR